MPTMLSVVVIGFVWQQTSRNLQPYLDARRNVEFPLAIAVIIATYLLFLCGSIVVLRLLRMKKSLYYQPDHFVTISGMFHRMRQNARGLATICILSTMLVVTVSGIAPYGIVSPFWGMLAGIGSYAILRRPSDSRCRTACSAPARLSLQT